MRTLNSNKLQTRVKVWVRAVPVGEQIFWFLSMTLAIVLFLAFCIALWQFKFVGGMVLGLILSKLLRS
jgi:hypothetical protein